MTVTDQFISRWSQERAAHQCRNKSRPPVIKLPDSKEKYPSHRNIKVERSSGVIEVIVSEVACYLGFTAYKQWIINLDSYLIVYNITSNSRQIHAVFTLSWTNGFGINTRIALKAFLTSDKSIPAFQKYLCCLGYFGNGISLFTSTRQTLLAWQKYLYLTNEVYKITHVSVIWQIFLQVSRLSSERSISNLQVCWHNIINPSSSCVRTRHISMSPVHKTEIRVRSHRILFLCGRTDAFVGTRRYRCIQLLLILLL